MNPKDLVRQYLKQVKLMQLATAADNQPWVCTVHYCVDQDFNFYWVSHTDRKHSRQITDNPKAAVTVMVHENTPDEDYVIGISAEGSAEHLDSVADEVVQAYIDQHGDDPDMADIAAGNSPHKFYRLKPSQIIMFNNKDFPDAPRQEVPN